MEVGKIREELVGGKHDENILINFKKINLKKLIKKKDSW